MSLPTQTRTLKECRSCSTCNVWFLHDVQHRGIYRSLCTSCVLRLHPASFCPTCFQLHDPTPPHPQKRIICSNCNSITHSNCVPPSSSAAPYLCPPCSSPDFVFFEVDKTPEGVRRKLDKKSVVVLLCATRIAAVSMGKAEVVARAEAERTVRESAVAGKRAKDGLLQAAAFADARRRMEEENGVGVGVGAGFGF